MAIQNNSNNGKKTTTTTTVKTLKGKMQPLSPMKSAEFYAEQAKQNNANANANANANKSNNANPANQQSKQLLKRLGIAGAVVAVLLGILFGVEQFNRPESPAEPNVPPLVIPDVASISENNQQNQNNQNADLQNIIPAENSNLNPELTAENPEKNNQNLVENNSQIATIDKTQPAAADSFGTFAEAEHQASAQAKSPQISQNISMQQGGHTILKLNPQQNQQVQQTQIKPIQKNNNEKSITDKSATNRKLAEMQKNQQIPQNFVAEETSAPPMLGSDKSAPSLPERNNLPNTRIVSMQNVTQTQITSAERSIIPNDKFRIQVGVFDSKANPQSAENLYQKLVAAGIPAVLENRVQVGPFTNKAQAEKAQQKLKELGINGVIVIPKN